MNLYLPVYERIENEVISLTNSICFDDAQLGTYSVSIGDIIVRCSIEIEALSKELYIREGGKTELFNKDGSRRDLYFDTDCISLLIDKWGIDKKKIQITNPNMYFGQDQSVLKPLYKSNKMGKSGSKWKQAYQNIKHNRSQSIKYASINNMLNALGALYILNIYYADENCQVVSHTQDINKHIVDSRVFTPFLFSADSISMNINMDDSSISANVASDRQDSIYLKRLTYDSFQHIHDIICCAAVEYACRTIPHDSFIKFIHQSTEIRAVLLEEITNKIGFFDSQATDKRSFLFEIHKLNQYQEIVVNKNDQIYPSLYYKDFLRSKRGIQKTEEVIQSLG